MYVNSTKLLDAKEERIEELQTELSANKSVSDSLQEQNSELQQFSLLKNDNAMTYFEDKGYNAEKVAQNIEDHIIDMNSANDDNPLVPFTGINGTGKMKVNNIKVLNHKWVIANFTDGTYWGEVFLSYEIGEGEEPIFHIEKAFLYPQAQN